jgi:hypothetical protein
LQKNNFAEKKMNFFGYVGIGVVGLAAGAALRVYPT